MQNTQLILKNVATPNQIYTRKWSTKMHYFFG